MIRTLTWVAVVLALAMPAVAQAVSQRAAALLAVIREHDCRLTRGQAADILPGLGFRRGEVIRLSRELKAAGLITSTKMELRATGDVCDADNGETVIPAVALTPLQEQYIAVLRHNGCQLQTGEAASLFPHYGMDANLAAEVEEGLLASGVAEIRDGALHVGGQYCLADDTFPTLPILELTATEQQLVDVLEAGSCTLVQSEISADTPGGMTPAQVQSAVESLLASGAARVVEGGDRLWLSPDICQPLSERKI